MAKPSLDAIRHSLAHLLAHAVQEEFPGAKFAIGPVIADGFYYDFDLPRPLTLEELPKLEKRMRTLASRGLPFAKLAPDAAEAKASLKNQPFKHELIEELHKKGETIRFYKVGAFTDLCRGGHVANTKEIPADGFALTSVAGAYWRGSEKNPMLTRVYGLAFGSKAELADALKRKALAKERDHRKLGAQLELFFFHETSPGAPYWLPNGLVILNALIDFWREEHRKAGYQEVASPLMNKKELWETSGHWEHYRDDMFLADMGKEEVYGVKPMNCPNAMLIFKHALRSYRDLPLRLSDTDPLHRYERSGTLNGLLRVRAFRQDDAHNFIRADQIENEYAELFKLAQRFYSVFGLAFRYRLGTRPEGFLGERATWDRAEATLRKILDDEVGKDKYEVLEGDGAFYGPKVDIIMTDALQREWQMGTFQLDFQQPKRFGLTYIDHRGKAQTPIAIHRVIYGSLERFIGLLIEHTGGAFPLWLSPVQVAILPVGTRHEPAAAQLATEFRAVGIRVTVDDANETVGNKIRKATKLKVPYVIVLGDKEATSTKLAVRMRGEQRVVSVARATFTKKIREAIAERTLDLP